MQKELNALKGLLNCRGLLESLLLEVHDDRFMRSTEKQPSQANYSGIHRALGTPPPLPTSLGGETGATEKKLVGYAAEVTEEHKTNTAIQGEY